MGYCDDLDDEEHPRNAAAIRTALMLGAEFEELLPTYPGGERRWSVKGIDCLSKNKTTPAWLFLATHGICITKDARACLCKDIHHEDIK